MAELSEWPNEQSNPDLANRFHIIHQIAGVWYSYWISLETIVNKVLSYVYGNKITQLDFTVAGYQDYTLEQYETLEYITVRYTVDVGTYSVGTAANDNLYVDASDENISPLFIYKYQSNASQRKIRITLTQPGIVHIKSVTGL